MNSIWRDTSPSTDNNRDSTDATHRLAVAGSVHGLESSGGTSSSGDDAPHSHHLSAITSAASSTVSTHADQHRCDPEISHRRPSCPSWLTGAAGHNQTLSSLTITGSDRSTVASRSSSADPRAPSAAITVGSAIVSARERRDGNTGTATQRPSGTSRRATSERRNRSCGSWTHTAS